MNPIFIINTTNLYYLIDSFSFYFQVL